MEMSESTQLQVRSAWLRWIWKWAHCAWMHQLCKYFHCCRRLRMNGRWKRMIYESIVLAERSVRTVANAILPNPMLFSQFSHQSKCVIWSFSHAKRIMNHSLLALPIFSQTSFIISPGPNLSPERLTIQGIWRRIRIQHIKVLSGPHY